MIKHHVRVLGRSVFLRASRHVDTLGCQAFHFAAVEGGYGHGGDASGIRVIKGFQQVGRVSGGRNADQYVAAFSQNAQLSDENFVIAEIIPDGSYERNIVGQAQGAEWLVINIGADRKIIGKMACRSGAAAIADKEDRGPALARLQQGLDESPNFSRIDALENGLQVREISARKIDRIGRKNKVKIVRGCRGWGYHRYCANWSPHSRF